MCFLCVSAQHLFNTTAISKKVQQFLDIYIHNADLYAHKQLTSVSRVFISCQGSCKSCDALTLFALSQWSCSPPSEDRNKGRRQDREGSSAYLRQHSLCLSITHKHSSAPNNAPNWIIYHTCSHAPINTNRKQCAYGFHKNQSDFSSAVRDLKCSESRPKVDHEGYKHRRTKNGCALIKSLVNSGKYID